MKVNTNLSFKNLKIYEKFIAHLSSRKKTIALFQKYVFLLQSSLENPSFTFEAFEQGILLWMTNYLFSLGVAHKISHIPKQNNEIGKNPAIDILQSTECHVL